MVSPFEIERLQLASSFMGGGVNGRAFYAIKGIDKRCSMIWAQPQACVCLTLLPHSWTRTEGDSSVLPPNSA
jgi:hypothetical protein